jgi:hypothetical protein
MGVNMEAYGSALRLRIGRDETEVLKSTIKQLLMGPEESYGSNIAMNEVASASTLEHLFAAYHHILFREDDQVVACTIADERWYDVGPLFKALAPQLADGSWYGFHVEDFDELLWVQDGEFHKAFFYSERPGDDLNPKIYQGDIDEPWLDASPPFTLFRSTDPYPVKVTAIASNKAGVQLLPCCECWDWEKHQDGVVTLFAERWDYLQSVLHAAINR